MNHAESLTNPTFVWEGVLPSSGVVLLHGSPGCGKSALLWGILHHCADGAPYLGIPTTPTSSILLCNDMNESSLKIRWANFNPKFAVCCMDRMDVTSPSNALYLGKIAEYVTDNNVQIIAVDALGGLLGGRSIRDDDTANLVVTRLHQLFPNRLIILLGHDRKMSQETKEFGSESFLGSQLWRAHCTVQLSMRRSGHSESRLTHSKSQVSPLLSNDIRLYIDDAGQAEAYNESRARTIIKQLQAACTALKLPYDEIVTGKREVTNIEAMALGNRLPGKGGVMGISANMVRKRIARVREFSTVNG